VDLPDPGDVRPQPGLRTVAEIEQQALAVGFEQKTRRTFGSAAGDCSEFTHRRKASTQWTQRKDEGREGASICSIHIRRDLCVPIVTFAWRLCYQQPDLWFCLGN